MAEDFGFHSNDKGKVGQQLPRRGAIPFDSGRRGRNDVRPIHAGKAEAAVAGPRFRTRRLAGTGPLFLLGLATVVAFYPGLRNKRITITSVPTDQPLRSNPTPQASSPAQALPTPSPIAAAVTAPTQHATMPKKTRKVVPDLPGPSAIDLHAMTYEATRKKLFGSCTGQLELTSVRLYFHCPSQADLSIPVDSIAKVHNDAVVLASGAKYQFLIANHTKDQVAAILVLWLDQAQRSHPPSRKPSL